MNIFRDIWRNIRVRIRISDNMQYCMIIDVDDYGGAAKQLLSNDADVDVDATTTTTMSGLQQQHANLCLAKLSSFVGDEGRSFGGSDAEQRLLWIDAQCLMQQYARHNHEDEEDEEHVHDVSMSKREIIQRLMALIVAHKPLNVAHIEQVLRLILDLEPMHATECDASDDSLVYTLIRSVMQCNKHEWSALQQIMNRDQLLADEPRTIQIMNRSAIHVVTKHLFNKVKKAEFLQRTRSDNADIGEDEDDDDANEIWELWKSGMNLFTSERHYFQVRAFGNAQQR